MASVVASTVLIFFVTFFLFTSASEADPSTKTQSVHLSKVLDEIRRLSDLNRLLDLEAQQVIGDGRRSTSDRGSSSSLEQKRQASLDMDYGWGGGRFGKRMDTLGIAGRFGRSVHEDKNEHYDA